VRRGVLWAIVRLRPLPLGASSVLRRCGSRHLWRYVEDIGLQISDLDLRLPGISSLAGGCSALPLVVQRPFDVDAHRDQVGGAIRRVCLAPGHLRQTHPRRPSAYVRPNHAPLNIRLRHQSGHDPCLRSTEHCGSGIKWLATQNRSRRCRRTRRPGTPCWPSSCPGAPGSPFPSRSRPSAAASSSSGARPLPSSSRPLSSLRAPCSTSPWFASTRASSATRPATARPPSGSCTAA
ncbi:WD-repeat family protein, partial [Giardia duodenalis]